jgi:hypothetical protein
MLHGSCLCQGVTYEITGALTQALNCHCSMCRKAHGAAFRSRARVKAADFRFTKGYDLITWYESSPGNHRGFCRVCGSPLLSRFDRDARVYGLPLGTLDDDPGVKGFMCMWGTRRLGMRLPTACLDSMNCLNRNA